MLAIDIWKLKLKISDLYKRIEQHKTFKVNFMKIFARPLYWKLPKIAEIKKISITREIRHVPESEHSAL